VTDRIEDLERAASDAKLNGLLSDGWSVVTAITIQVDKGSAETRLVLRPPLPWLRQAIVSGATAGVVAGVVIWALSSLGVALGL
jgi:hypothetical protein